jgi:hypothetical protein
MRVAALLLLLTAACEPALKLPDRPSESYVASGSKWLQRNALDRHCGCVGTLPTAR